MASLSASIGVIMTALACAHFVLSPRYNAYDSAVSTSIVAARFANVRSRDDGISASAHVATSSQTLMASPVAEGNDPWPKVVWLMSFPNR